MVKLYDVNRSTAHLTPLTLCPGTMAYMSPEALGEPPIYTDKLDSFSFGVLCVQIMTQQFPDPGNRFNTIEINDPRAPSGRVQVEIPERERRRSHIDLIDPAHPLLPVALDCLKDREGERPSCHELCGRMSTLKASPKYTESVQQSQVNTKPTQSANRESKEREIQQLQQYLLERERTIRDQQRQIQELQQQLGQRGGRRREEVKASGATASGGSMKLRWRDGGRAPRKMFGEVTAVDGGVAYFKPGFNRLQTVFAYNSSDNKWSALPECPNRDFSLAVINSLLTAIGGVMSNRQVTNSLLSLTDNKWIKQFPPMPTKHRWTVAVCSGKSLVVAGGYTVEVMDTETLHWSTASSLPHPLYCASATLCGDQVYMLGGFDEGNKYSKSAFTCSLTSLLKSSQPQSSGARPRRSLTKVWHQLADTPVTFSTCASLQGQLLAVGGFDSDDKPITAVHMYNPTTNSWEVISHMATPRYECLVAVLPHNKLMVVGGRTLVSASSVEIATVVE